MQDLPIAIIGRGLSGLYAAFLLEQCGIDYILLEARDRLNRLYNHFKTIVSKQSFQNNHFKINGLIDDTPQ
ncbi:NAD(P)-binding protein [Psychrobacter immobilis]|uniref:NAD(P)-binding protein n=1 Tax=Psychrobacter immobilis TaxID=498 RepID=UPI0039B76547